VAVLLLLAGTLPVFSQNPVANFTANVTSGCVPLTVSFTDQSTGNPTSWNWEFSNGTLSSVRNPVVTFSTPGTYSVRLVVQNSTGIAQTERIDYITVYPSPTANFNASLTLACVPATIQFTDASTTTTGTIVSWEWDFGDGGTSTQQNPSHTYTNVGFYAVTLTVTSSTGCKQTRVRSSYIRIVGSIDTDFDFTPPATCRPPYAVNFRNQSNGPGTISYSWNFGNGQTSTAVNPTATYTAPGTYTVTLNTSSTLGCTGTLQKRITINSATTDFAVPADICLNVPVTFQNTSSPNPESSLWFFGDGTSSGQINAVKAFTTPGTYNVRLVNRYSTCTDSITKPVTVNALPAVDFRSNDSTFCQAPASVQFTDLTPGAVSWQWNFGDGTTSTEQNPTHQYTAEGVYTVTLTAVTASGCQRTVVKPDFITVKIPEVEINAPTGGCIPFRYTPTVNIVTVDTVASYSWNLGEPGAIFNVRNPPPYTYNSPGNYNISLTITTVSGCTKTVTIPNGVRTGVPPTVAFSVAPLDDCASTLFNFTDQSITTPGALVEWLWNFGDGSTSTLQHPTHQFQDTGNLVVTLQVSNNKCIRIGATQTVHVKPPVADFRYAVNCNNREVTFTDESKVDPTLTPLTYLWEMGDPANTQFITQIPPPFTYPGPGTYIVNQTITNGTCSYTQRKQIIIADEQATFTINTNPVCKGQPFTLSATGILDADNIRNYRWIVDGVVLPETDAIVHYSLANAGTYDVTLTITDINGCTSTRTIADYIQVNGPTARFTPSAPGACLDKTISFTDQTTPAGSIRNWQFNFGDGTTQTFTAPPFTHTYNQVGSYPVQMTVTDAAGCTDRYQLPANVVVSNPRAGFRAYTVYCPETPLQFIDTSAGVNLSYAWSFGDGGTSTDANPLHSYPAPDADYTVKLVVTDASGCQDSVVRPAYVKIRSPKAAFSIKDTTTLCPPLRTSFTFAGQDYSSFYWSFGDGGMSTLQNPSYFYGNYGTFTPKLYLTGNGGCIDSAQSSVTVHNPADIRISYGPQTRACNSLEVDFNLTMPAGYKFYFYFGDGTVDSTRRTSFSHLYSKPSFNRPYLVIFDTISGCQNTVTGNPRIDVMGAIPLFGKDRKEFCDTGTVSFTDFTTKNEPIISTLWSFGDGNTSTAQSPAHRYTQPGTYVVRLDITTQSNCSSFALDTILVYRTPQPSIAARDTICINATESFGGSIAVPDSITKWQWNFGNGQGAASQNGSATYNTAGDFVVQLITANKIGCSDTAFHPLYVSPLPTATPQEDPITIISGASTPLLMTYTGNMASYTWAPQYRLSCFNCPQPVANPQATTTYRVNMETVHGCRNTGSVTVNVVCNNFNFFVPNTFSPNGDGRNESFFPRGTGLFKIRKFTIFNRWGQVVFDRKDFNPNDAAAGWDGTFKGQKASADVYIYLMEIVCENNSVIPVKGNVTLLR